MPVGKTWFGVTPESRRQDHTDSLTAIFLQSPVFHVMEPRLFSLLKGGTAQVYSVTFSSMEVAPVSYPESQRQRGSLLGLLQEEYPEAHQLRRRFGSSCIKTGAEVASPWDRLGTARGSIQRKLKWSQLTQSMKLKERGQRGEESG